MKCLGHVVLVGAGPGDPDLMTVKAQRALAGAEAVVHDRLVSPEILSLVPSIAKLISVGKKPKHHPVPHQAINRLLVDLSRQGLAVVRLKGAIHSSSAAAGRSLKPSAPPALR